MTEAWLCEYTHCTTIFLRVKKKKYPFSSFLLLQSWWLLPTWSWVIMYPPYQPLVNCPHEDSPRKYPIYSVIAPAQFIAFKLNHFHPSGFHLEIKFLWATNHLNILVFLYPIPHIIHSYMHDLQQYDFCMFLLSRASKGGDLPVSVSRSLSPLFCQDLFVK